MANPHPKPPRPGSRTPWRKSFIAPQFRRTRREAKVAARQIAKMRTPP